MKARALMPLSLLIATAAFAGSASAQGQAIQPTAGQSRLYIVLFDQANYRGTPFNFYRSTANVASQWRRRARSVTIGNGTWQLCENPNFNGRCVTLSQSVADLATLNMRSIGSVRPVGAAPPSDIFAVLHSQTNYRGTTRRLTSASSNLGLTFIRSITIGGGSWQVCSNRDFGGRCVVLNQSVADLSRQGLTVVRSIRPVIQPRGR